MNSNGRMKAPYILATGCVLILGSALSLADQPTPTPDPTPKVEDNQKALSEVAKTKPLKGAEDGKAIVITNENLADYASKGSLTTTTGKGDTEKTGRRPLTKPGSPGTAADMVEAPPSGAAHTDERRRYWVDQYERQLELIASIKNQIEVLDRQIPGLWRDFYAWDDPSYRDGVIKPKLDEALNRRERLEADLSREEPRLQEIKSNARQDGAEPGWFRGISQPTQRPEEPTPDIMPP
jgi:hypothetical protein